MDSSVKKFIWQKGLIKNKKLRLEEKQTIVLLLGDLLGNGFSFQESLNFMGLLLEKEKWAIQVLIAHLEVGQPIYSGFEKIGYSKQQVAQLNLAEVHGDLIGTFKTMGKHLLDSQKQKQMLVKVLSYPCLLLFFLMGMLLGMKWYLLPQLASISGGDLNSNLSVLLIERGPLIAIGFLVVLCLILFFVQTYLKGKTAIGKSLWVVKIPGLRQFYRFYYTAFFAMEWGKLFQQGLELTHILNVMTKEGNTRLMQEIALVLQKKLESGEPVHVQLAKWPFFLEGFSRIIQQGEMKGKLGEELVMYGKRTWERLIKKIEKSIRWLQPLIFLIVAILIVSIYAALLLPLYDGMDTII